MTSAFFKNVSRFHDHKCRFHRDGRLQPQKYTLHLACRQRSIKKKRSPDYCTRLNQSEQTLLLRIIGLAPLDIQMLAHSLSWTRLPSKVPVACGSMTLLHSVKDQVDEHRDECRLLQVRYGEFLTGRIKKFEFNSCMRAQTVRNEHGVSLRLRL